MEEIRGKIEEESKKIGRKAAQLKWLQTELHNNPNFTFVQSVFVTDKQVTTCLELDKHNPLQPVTREIISACFNAKKITPEMAILLQECRDLLHEKLSFSASFEEILQKHIYTKFPENEMLIFRSSSNEDQQGNPNAGGNESRQGIQNRGANFKAELIAVLCSYLSENSFNQQLQTVTCEHDATTLLTTWPTLAVLVQKCLRTQHQDILITGNLISTDPITGIDGVVTIQSGFGAEVGTRPEIPADKYTVLPDNFIVPSIRNKTYRLQDDNGATTTLRKLPNNFATATRRSLEKESVIKLAELARQLKQRMGHDVEIEFAQVGNQLFLLQWRPYQQSVCETPQYLDDRYFHTTEDHMRCTALTAVSQHVVIFKRKHVLAGQTALDVLRKFEGLSDKSGVKTIFINEKPALLSHPMVNFQHWKIPVYFVSDPEKISSSPKSHIVVDFQRQELICTDTLPENRHWNIGWHRIPLLDSISSDCGELNALTAEGLQPHLPRLKKYRLSKALRTVRQQNISEVTDDQWKSLSRAVIFYAFHFIKNLVILEAEHTTHFKAVTLFALKIMRSLSQEDSPVLLLEKTFFLQLLTQVADKNTLRAHSFFMLIKEFELLQNSPEPYFSNTIFKQYQLVYTKFEYFFDTPQKKDAFYLMLNTLLTDEKTAHQFNAVIMVFSRLSLLAAWFHYLLSLKEPAARRAHLETLFTELGKPLSVFRRLLFIQAHLTTLEKTETLEQLSTVNGLLLFLLNTIDFKALSEQDASFIVSPLLALLLRAINLYDALIKRQMLSQDTPENIRQALSLFSLFVVSLLEKINAFRPQTGYSPPSLTQTSALEAITNRLVTNTQYALSADFDVNLCVVDLLNTSTRNFNKHRGASSSAQTAHDLLTILHKTAQNVSSKLGEYTHQVTDEHFPDFLNQLDRCIIAEGVRNEKVFHYYGAGFAQRLLKHSDDNGYSCQYLLPLRHHGILVSAKQKRRGRHVEIEITCYGDDEWGRNQRSNKIATLIAKKLPETSRHHSHAAQNVYTLSFICTEKCDLKKFGDLFYIIADISLSVSFRGSAAYPLILQCEQTALDKITLSEAELQTLSRVVVSQSVETKTLHPLLSWVLHSPRVTLSDSTCETLVPVVRLEQHCFGLYSQKTLVERGQFLSCLRELVKKGHALVLARETLETIIRTYQSPDELSKADIGETYVELLLAYHRSGFRPLDNSYHEPWKQYFDQERFNLRLNAKSFFKVLLDYLYTVRLIPLDKVIQYYDNNLPIKPDYILRAINELPDPKSWSARDRLCDAVKNSLKKWIKKEPIEIILQIIEGLALPMKGCATAMHQLLKHVEGLDCHEHKEKQERIKQKLLECLCNTHAQYHPSNITVCMFNETIYMPGIFLHHCLAGSTEKKLPRSPFSSEAFAEMYFDDLFRSLNEQELFSFLLALYTLLAKHVVIPWDKKNFFEALFILFHLNLERAVQKLPPSTAHIIKILRMLIFCNLLRYKLVYHPYEEKNLSENFLESLLTGNINTHVAITHQITLLKKLMELLSCVFNDFSRDLECGYNYPNRSIAIQAITAQILRAFQQLIPVFNKLFYKNKALLEECQKTLKSCESDYHPNKPEEQKTHFEQHIRAPLRTLLQALPSEADLLPEQSAIAESGITLLGSPAKKPKPNPLLESDAEEAESSSAKHSNDEEPLTKKAKK